MLQLVFRSFFFIAVILGYSTGIWRLINDYFRHEFQSYLEQESQSNKYLLRDPPEGAKVVLSGRTFPAQASASGDEDGPAEACATHRTVTDSISEFSNPIAAGTDFLPSPVVPGNGEAGEKAAAKMATEAAEVTDIRHRQREERQSEAEDTGEVEEDKWIAYWLHRGKGNNGDSGTNAFCSIGRNPSGPPETLMEKETEECGERESVGDL